MRTRLTQYADAVLWASSNSPSPRKSNNHNNCSILLCRTTSFRRVCCSNKDREYSVGALFSRAVPLGTPVVSKTSACFKSAAAVRKKIFFLLLPIEFIFHMNVMDTWMDCILLFIFRNSEVIQAHTQKRQDSFLRRAWNFRFFQEFSLCGLRELPVYYLIILRQLNGLFSSVVSLPFTTFTKLIN